MPYDTEDNTGDNTEVNTEDDTGTLIQGSRVQSQWVAPRLTQPFIFQS